MSVRAAKALGAEYAGVDILPIEGGGYSLIEVNTIPGWKGLKKATGFDAAEYLADFVLKTTH
jgi:glutathione synthase/RimK-type ligase-like ATP-grasp enzyme